MIENVWKNVAIYYQYVKNLIQLVLWFKAVLFVIYISSWNNKQNHRMRSSNRNLIHSKDKHWPWPMQATVYVLLIYSRGCWYWKIYYSPSEQTCSMGLALTTSTFPRPAHSRVRYETDDN